MYIPSRATLGWVWELSQSFLDYTPQKYIINKYPPVRMYPKHPWLLLYLNFGSFLKDQLTPCDHHKYSFIPEINSLLFWSKVCWHKRIHTRAHTHTHISALSGATFGIYNSLCNCWSVHERKKRLHLWNNLILCVFFMLPVPRGWGYLKILFLW